MSYAQDSANPAQVTDAMVEAAAASLRPDLFTPLDPDDLRSDDFAWTRREDAKATALRKARSAIIAAIGAGGQASGAVTFYDKDNCPVCHEPDGQAVAELRQIEEMLDAGQGDDDGPQIMPDFEPDMSTLAKVEACLFLLEKRRDVIEAFTHPAPSGQAVAVKALEWYDPGNRIEYADTLLGSYKVNASGSWWLDNGAMEHCGSREAAYAAAQADYERRILSVIAHPSQPGWRPTHRHVKRGSEYMLLGIGKMQSGRWFDLLTHNGVLEAKTSVDMCEVAIYRSEDGKLWVRPREEFEDGRFEALPAAPQPKGE